MGDRGCIQMMHSSNKKIREDRMAELIIFSIVKNPVYLFNDFLHQITRLRQKLMG